jgi:RNA polymerase sigma-70 factor (ECF subfamily)
MFQGWTRPEKQSFPGIYGRFRRPIFLYVRSRVHEDETAEDLVQEIFLKVFRFLGSYREQYAFSTWLWTIARNTVADYLRAPREPSSAGEVISELEELPCAREDAETVLARKDERRSFLRLLRPLTRLQKRVLWMRIVHQLSYDEIASRLGVSLSAVKNLAHRARIRLGCSLAVPPEATA